MKLHTSISRKSLPLFFVLALSPAMLFAGSSPKTTTEHGIIKAVDASTHTLTVAEKKSGAETKFQWNEHTKFTEHHKAVSASVLKEGERAELTFAPGGNMAMLKTVAIAPAKSEGHASDQATANKKHKAHY
jgi:hypothetical protein